jgi:hypothetical protein
MLEGRAAVAVFSACGVDCFPEKTDYGEIVWHQV